METHPAHFEHRHTRNDWGRAVVQALERQQQQQSETPQPIEPNDQEEQDRIYGD